MAIIFMPYNGIGLGHLSRSFALAQSLQLEGLCPVIFSQGRYPDYMNQVVPGVSVGRTSRWSLQERTEVERVIQNFARYGSPSVLVEDTHPSPLALSADVARMMIVRPTSIDYMRFLQSKYQHTYGSFLVADHPQSPTWPYSRADTDEIARWEGWHLIGPVYRRTSPEGERAVRRDLGIGAADRVVVFSMGGGGAHEGAGDVDEFCTQAENIGWALQAGDRNSRLLFVRGPLFPKERSICRIFEDIPEVSDMPALLAIAERAVIRAGYNTIWECIAGGTAFWPIAGMTFQEPVADRAQSLRRHHLVPSSLEEWLGPSWPASFTRAVACMERSWGAEPAGRTVARILRKDDVKRDIGSHGRFSVIRKPRGDRRRVLVRIDDVTELDEELLLTIEMCAIHGLRVSLEVIPYLSTLREESLIQLIRMGAQIEVSQHGYAHIPRKTADGRKAEFHESHCDRSALAAGFRKLSSTFPHLFRGGFSAPYGFAPNAIYAVWDQLGGRYASACKKPATTPPLPVCAMTMDPWNWSDDAPVGVGHLAAQASAALETDNYVGVVLHHGLLRREGEPARLEGLLSAIADLDCTPAFISEVALNSR